MDCASACWSKEPKPSSTNMADSRMPPEEDWISSDRPNASDSAAMKDSPPERLATSRVEAL